MASYSNFYPQTANQIKAVSDKISTGIKVIEVTTIDPNKLDYVPKQHFEEINRLKKLAGIDLTFHGPLVEATGLSDRGWDRMQREEAEKKIINAVERGHQLDPEGNIVITFHSGVAGIDPAPKIKIKDENGNEKEIVTHVLVMNERSGEFARIPLMQKKYFPGEEREPGDITKIDEEIKDINKRTWETELESLSERAFEGNKYIEVGLKGQEEDEQILKKAGETSKVLLEHYKNYSDPEVQKDIKYVDELTGGRVTNKIQRISHGSIYVREAYTRLKKMFDEAYETVENNPNSKVEKAKLDEYKKEIAPLVKDLEDPSNIDKLAKEVMRGVNVLRTITPPEKYKPLKQFMIDKASDTFSNAALHAYDKFKESAPIISIENPPAGTAALSRAEDLRKLIEVTQDKFVRNAKEKFGMSEGEAREQANKLIGATWDVGHINMIRRFGFSEKDVVKEAKTIAPFVKHVHLSDNFGVEHTELPMGMGNVPTKEIMELHENFRKARKIIETGGWYPDFKSTPFKETLTAFGSPLYSMQMGPTWNQIAHTSSGYFAGYGINPEVHHSIYGAGFSGLPVSLGGQIEGRSRVSGTPME